MASCPPHDHTVSHGTSFMDISGCYERRAEDHRTGLSIIGASNCPSDPRRAGHGCRPDIHHGGQASGHVPRLPGHRCSVAVIARCEAPCRRKGSREPWRPQAPSRHACVTPRLTAASPAARRPRIGGAWHRPPCDRCPPLVRSGTGESDARFAMAMEDSPADRCTAGSLPKRARRNAIMRWSRPVACDGTHGLARRVRITGARCESSNISFDTEPSGQMAMI